MLHDLFVGKRHWVFSIFPPSQRQYFCAAVCIGDVLTPPSGHSPRMSAHSSHAISSANSHTPNVDPSFRLSIRSVPPFFVQLTEAGLARLVGEGRGAGLVGAIACQWKMKYPRKLMPIRKRRTVTIFPIHINYMHNCPCNANAWFCPFF